MPLARSSSPNSPAAADNTSKVPLTPLAVLSNASSMSFLFSSASRIALTNSDSGSGAGCGSGCPVPSSLSCWAALRRTRLAWYDAASAVIALPALATTGSSTSFPKFRTYRSGGEIDFVAPSMDDRVAIEVIDELDDALLQLVCGVDTD